MRSRKKNGQPPIWLRRLKQVKAELRGTSWPSPAAGFHECFGLMAFGLNALHGPGVMAAFARADERWLARWKRERGKIFSRRT